MDTKPFPVVENRPECSTTSIPRYILKLEKEKNDVVFGTKMMSRWMNLIVVSSGPWKENPKPTNIDIIEVCVACKISLTHITFLLTSILWFYVSSSSDSHLFLLVKILVHPSIFHFHWSLPFFSFSTYFLLHTFHLLG